MHGTWVEVHLDTVRANLAALRAALPARVAPIVVVKANAYGHGLPLVAGCVVAAGADWLAVAHLHEALAARAAAPRPRLLLLGPPEPADVPALLAHRIVPVVVDAAHGRALAAAARRAGAALPVHLKLDTGMGRMGFLWETAAAEAEPLWAEAGLDIQGLCTHFARVEPGEDDPARAQAERFARVAAALEARAGRSLFKHTSSSRAILCRPEWDFDAVRPGILAYGYGASAEEGRVRTRPALEWKTRVVQTRRVPANFPVGYYSTYRTPAATTLAVLAVGYADGYLRTLSNKGQVLIGGRRCRVVGRVSMNWMTVDVGPYGQVAAGDEAVLIGRQGNQEIWADELAVLCRTIPYEILTNIRDSIERCAV